MARLRTSRLASLGALLFVCLMGSAFAQERFARQVSFDIAAQSVEAALLEFSKQADVQVMVGTSSLNGQKTDGVKGTLAVKDALRELLKNTGLEYRTEGNGTVTIRSATAAKTDARVRPLVEGSRLASRDAAGEAAGNDVLRVGESAQPAVETLDEVVVTGTHLRGQTPIGATLVTLDRDEILRTGRATVHDVVHTLPQNFLGGGANEGTRIGGGTNINSSAASSINLRGLGPGSTLVLLNGRRLPVSGDASFVDVSSLPVAAIDRIELLLDGASAVYGADAVAGVVNVILRRDYQGAETSALVGVPTQGAAEEYSVGQVFGTHWDSGNAMLTYDYHQRDALPMRERGATQSADLRSHGGLDLRQLQSNPGTIVSGTRTWAIPSGQDGSSLVPGSFVEGTRNIFDQNEVRRILPDQKRHSAILSLNQYLGSRIELHADILGAKRDATAVNTGLTRRLSVPSTNGFYVNPTGGTGNVSVDYNFIDDLGPATTDIEVDTFSGGLGADFKVTDSWTVSTHVDHARETIDQSLLNQPIVSELTIALADPNRATAFNSFGDGSFTNPQTVDRIRGSTTFASDSRISTATLTANGPIAQLPGGKLAVAAGLEYREQEFDTEARTLVGDPTINKTTDARRNIQAAFLELRAPIVGADNARSGVRRLALSLAGRYEEYSDFGSKFTPAAALEWAPVDDVTLRVSRSESFRAPKLPDIDETDSSLFIVPLPDPQSATGTSDALLLAGLSNADLEAEESTAWTAGIKWRPTAVPGLSLDASYFDIEFKNRIQFFGTLAFTFLQDPRFSYAVIRSPTLEQRQAVCARAIYDGLDPSECTDFPVEALVDTRPRNAATTKEQGLDFFGSYVFEAPIGQLDVGLNATYLLEFEEALSSTAPIVELRNTPFQPVDFRVRASLGWSHAGWGISTTVNYTDQYVDTLSVPSRPISSWTTADFQVRYKADPGAGGWLIGTSLALSITNAFDRDPPFFANAAAMAFDPTNSDVLGRVVSLRFQKDWAPGSRR